MERFEEEHSLLAYVFSGYFAVIFLSRKGVQKRDQSLWAGLGNT